jgi:hypothetical protein
MVPNALSPCLEGSPGQGHDGQTRPPIELGGWRGNKCHRPALMKFTGLRAGSVIVRFAIA